MRYLWISLIFLLASCKSTTNSFQLNKAFKDHWFDGKAELSSYKLEQMRYGETRKGKAVLIFVTEDWSPKKLVKLNNPSSAKRKTTVLKMNQMRKFVTGIYPYSVMTSAFTPIENPMNHPLKVSFSSQEWCGQVYSELSAKGKRYHIRTESYFENGNQDKYLTKGWTEDEIFNLIRIAPEDLPKGDIKIIPSLMHGRFNHQKSTPVMASADISEKKNLKIYTLSYDKLNRQVKIGFESKFPHEIEYWKEKSITGKDTLKTSAKRMKRKRLSYWNLNSNKDSVYREMLGL